jgi:hypothetical protein
VNQFYVDKVARIRATIAGAADASTTAWPPATASFQFKFASASRISQVVRSLGSSEALGVDKIPVSIWKKGIETLACPIAHLVNRSLALGIVPEEFKQAIIHPIHKGGGKPRSDPGSYRPVSILTALSKVLETVVKEDLVEHLDNVGALPNTQHGF